MNQREALRLNVRASAATKGGGAKPVEDIIELLKSDAPIESWVRRDIAKLLEQGLYKKSKQIRLVLRGQDEARRNFKYTSSRHEWYELGKLMKQHMSQNGGKTREKTRGDVEERIPPFENFNASEGTAEYSLSFYNAVKRWMGDVQKTEAGLSYDEYTLLDLYITYQNYISHLSGFEHYEKDGVFYASNPQEALYLLNKRIYDLLPPIPDEPR